MSVQQLIELGTLPAQRIGRDYLIQEKDLSKVTIHGKAGRPKKNKMDFVKTKGRKNFDGKLRRRRTAYHEAGHAVMSVIFQDIIEFARIGSFYSDEENIGFVRTLNQPPFLNCQCESQSNKYLESRIMRHLAGYVAQYLYPAKKAGWYNLYEYFYDDLTIVDGDSTDYAKILVDLKSLAIFDVIDRNQEEFQNHYESFLIEKCRNILQQPPIWEALKTVAETLLDKSEMTGYEIQQACYSVGGFTAISKKLGEIYLGVNNFEQRKTA